MSLIDYNIPTQAFEKVRDRVGEILASELKHQMKLTYDSEIDAKVYVERMIVVDSTECPLINVNFDRSERSNQDQVTKGHNLIINIDHFHNAKSTSQTSGDVKSMFKLQKMMGMSAYILEHPEYKTLGFAPPFIMNRHVQSMAIAEASRYDSNNITMGRIVFSVRVPEISSVKTPELIGGMDTQVKLVETEKGFMYVS